MTRWLFAIACAAALAPAAALPLSRIFGIFPGEESLQDFWGPVRAGFEATLPSEDVWGAANEEEVASAIAEILDRTADAPHEVLIVGPMRYGEAHYAEVLKRGGATFFLAEGVDLETYGLTNETSFQYIFNPDTVTAAQNVAREICRTTGPGYVHRVMKLYGTESVAGVLF